MIRLADINIACQQQAAAVTLCCLARMTVSAGAVTLRRWALAAVDMRWATCSGTLPAEKLRTVSLVH